MMAYKLFGTSAADRDAGVRNEEGVQVVLEFLEGHPETKNERFFLGKECVEETSCWGFSWKYSFSDYIFW